MHLGLTVQTRRPPPRGGWGSFPVAPINMILAAAYITQLFGLPAGGT